MQSNGKKITTGANILANEKCANLDFKYGPYQNREQVMEVLGEDGLDCIARGLTVGIFDDEEGIVEYQFKKGVTLDDLVRKFPKSSAGGDWQVPEGSTPEETPDIDSAPETQSFLEGFTSQDKLKNVLEEQNQPLTDEQMQSITDMFPTE